MRRTRLPGVVGTGLLATSVLLATSCGPAAQEESAGGVGAVTPVVAPDATEDVTALAERIKARVTLEDLTAAAEGIVRHERASGGPGESAAIDHVVATLEEQGISVQVHRFDAYVSDPILARVSVVGGDFEPPAITMAYSAAVDSLVAPIIDVGALSDLPSLEEGTGERLAVQGDGLASADDALSRFPSVRGRIALVTGQPRNVPTATLESLGALGVVFVNPEERLNELIVTSTWGSPSLRNYHRLPGIPVAQVARSAGDSLRALLDSGPVTLTLSTKLDTGWKSLRLAVARIDPPRSPAAPYVLFGGHIDAWFHGATDEGASNAAMLSLTKAFHAERASLGRGLVVAWWPGHSNGRYAGSTWFADRFANEMRDRALAYVNVDGIGQSGAARYSASASAELAPLATRVIRDATGTVVGPSRPGTNSDQSFNGVGVPLLQLNHTRLAEDRGTWWWHTRNDTYDKIDFDVLREDAHLYADALSELLSADVYPVDLMALATTMGDALASRGEEADGRLDLGLAASRHLELTHAFAILQAALRPAADLDRQLLRVIRPIHRILYVGSAEHHPDPGLGPGPLPGLAAARVLAEERPDSDRFRFAQTSLLRERNRIVEALDRSIEEARRLTELLRETPE